MGSKYLFKVRYGAAAFAIGASMLLGAVEASANAKGDEEAVAPVKVEEAAPVKAEEAEEASVVIDGGTVSSETVIDISVDGGTAISDASGGDDNFAFTTVDAVGGDDDTDGRGGVLGLRDELIGGGDSGVAGDVAAAGNGGTADASASGGAVSVGDINSGGNAGNTIEVGNTGVPVEEVKKPEAPKPVAPKPEAPKAVDTGKKVVDTGRSDSGTGSRKAAVDVAPAARGGDRARNVASLPSTGIGPMVQGETGTDALLLVAGAIAVAGAAGVTARKRLA